MADFSRNLGLVCRMIKIEHSIFALPFAYAGAFLAARGWPGLSVVFFLTVAMVAVRSYAMTVNRLLDLDLDRENPRTKTRPLVTGELSVRFAVQFCLVSAAVFVLACLGLNRLCLYLSPVALGWSAFYSATKRFTWACHFVLGSVLGLAPLAGWIGVAEAVSPAAALLLLGVTFWVGGFDILYACQDLEFDRGRGLHSIPARFGLATALTLSTASHVLAAIFFFLAGWAAGAGWVFQASMAVIAAILLFEHRLISPQDLSRVNMAFFTLNGVVAVFVFVGVLLDLAFAR